MVLKKKLLPIVARAPKQQACCFGALATNPGLPLAKKLNEMGLLGIEFGPRPAVAIWRQHYGDGKVPTESGSIFGIGTVVGPMRTRRPKKTIGVPASVKWPKKTAATSAHIVLVVVLQKQLLPSDAVASAPKQPTFCFGALATWPGP